MRQSDVALIAQTRADLASGRARIARETAKITQGEMAAALGVSRSAVGHWETGKRTPNGPLALEYGRFLRQLTRKAA